MVCSVLPFHAQERPSHHQSIASANSRLSLILFWTHYYLVSAEMLWSVRPQRLHFGHYFIIYFKYLIFQKTKLQNTF